MNNEETDRILKILKERVKENEHFHKCKICNSYFRCYYSLDCYPDNKSRLHFCKKCVNH